jgi:cytochrome c5
MWTQFAATGMICAAFYLMHTASALAENNSSAQKKAQNSTAKVSNVKQDIGERKFRTNCGRCHSMPEQLSPRISGTVLQHMRVRALLSAEDEQQILRYLAP